MNNNDVLINPINSYENQLSNYSIVESRIEAMELKVETLTTRINELTAELNLLNRPFCEKVDEALNMFYSEIKNRTVTMLNASSTFIANLDIKQSYERAVAFLDKQQENLDILLPQNKLQKILDDFHEFHLKPLLDSVPANPLKEWIDSKGYDTWYQQFGLYLAKLSYRAVRNNLLLFYNLLQATVRTPVHPLDSAINLAKVFIASIYALTLPENLSQLGSGTIGAGLGQLLIVSPAPYLFIGFGGVILLSGIAYEAAKRNAFAGKKLNIEIIKEVFWENAERIPESFLTGFVGGLFKGGIQKLTEKKFYDKLTTKKQVQEYLDREFLKKYNLPQPQKQYNIEPPGIFVDPKTGNIRLHWSKSALQQIQKTNPSISFWPKPYNSDTYGMNMDIIHPSLMGNATSNISTHLFVPYGMPRNLIYLKGIDYPMITTSWKIDLNLLGALKLPEKK